MLSEIAKLSPKHFVKITFEIAYIRYMDDIRQIIVPVSHYIQGDTGFEIIPVECIAKFCPWDMERTKVTIMTEHTKIIDQNLHDMVIESPDAHRKLCALEGQ